MNKQIWVYYFCEINYELSLIRLNTTSTLNLIKSSFFQQYALLLGIIFIIELAVGIAACLFKADMSDLLNESMEKSLVRSTTDDLYAWDNVQRKLMCCGVTNPQDWVELSKDKKLRPSCCRPEFIDPNTSDCVNHDALYADKYYQVK